MPLCIYTVRSRPQEVHLPPLGLRSDQSSIKCLLTFMYLIISHGVHEKNKKLLQLMLCHHPCFKGYYGVTVMSQCHSRKYTSIGLQLRCKTNDSGFKFRRMSKGSIKLLPFGAKRPNGIIQYPHRWWLINRSFSFSHLYN